jgi:hypothetical protein
MSYYMLATFADSFRNTPAREELKKLRGALSGPGTPRAEWHGADLNALEPEEMEHLLADTVLKEFKMRLGRIGIEYQTPVRP